MLSYQHGYHAGNFADVVKHFTLSRLLNYLTQKDKPFFYLETHSGRGLYDLFDKQATKTGEYSGGIGALWGKRSSLPSTFSNYLEEVAKVNTRDRLRYYPGSPLLAIQALRSQDRFMCCEMHPHEFEILNQLPHRNKRGVYFEGEGLGQLKATLPPQERRGLIFIDPSYEVKTEYRLLPELLKKAYERFETGVYCVWYPLVDKKLNEKLQRGFTAIQAKSSLRVEFNLQPAFKTVGMNGCGLWIINPPYVLESELKEALTALCKLLNPGLSSFVIKGN